MTESYGIFPNEKMNVSNSAQRDCLIKVITKQQDEAQKLLEKQLSCKISLKQDENNGNEQNIPPMKEISKISSKQTHLKMNNQLISQQKQRLQDVINRQQKEHIEYQLLQQSQSQSQIYQTQTNNNNQHYPPLDGPSTVLLEKDSNQNQDKIQSQQFPFKLPFKKQQFQQSSIQAALNNLLTDADNEDIDYLSTKTNSDIIPLPPKGKNQLIEFTLVPFNRVQISDIPQQSKPTILTSQPLTSAQGNISILKREVVQINQIDLIERPENGMNKNINFTSFQDTPHLMENFNNLCNLLTQNNSLNSEDSDDKDFLKQLMELNINANQSLNQKTESLNQLVKPQLEDTEMNWNCETHSQATTQISLNLGTPLSTSQPLTPLSFRSPVAFRNPNASVYYQQYFRRNLSDE